MAFQDRPELGQVNARALASRFGENLTVIPSSLGENSSNIFCASYVP